jgi:hypothetical protein
MASPFQFCTAVIGEPYRRVGEALIATFSQFHDADQLHVFTDLDLGASATTQVTWQELTEGLPAYYQTRARVFKFQLLREMFERYPSREIVWIDADAVVMAPLSEHLRPGALNVMSLNRNGTRPEGIGNGVVVPSSRYVTSNFFSVPSIECVDALDALLRQRLGWPDAAELADDDQILVNHLVHSGVWPVHWVGCEGDGWFSTGCAVELQDRQTHADVTSDEDGRRILFRGEPLVLFSPTKLLVDLSFMNGFDSYPPLIRDRLRSVYGWNQIPRFRQLLGRMQRALVWDLPRAARRRLRSIRPLTRLVHRIRDRTRA